MSMTLTERPIKVVIINLMVLLFLGGVGLVLPALVNSAWNVLRGNVQDDPRAALPNYDGADWANTHFAELIAAGTVYKDYVTWQREDFSGETVTVIDGRRVTPAPAALIRQERVHFFGGSTVWGTGVRDAGTIPALAATDLQQVTINHGESGYIARQSLARLTNEFVTGGIASGDMVIFYDGVNEVLARCRNEISGLATSREQQIADLLAGQASRPPLSWSYLLEPWRVLGRKIRSKAQPDLFRCAKDERRAQEVADTLIGVWDQAAKMSRANGAMFLAVLQPVAYDGSVETGHLPDFDHSDELGQQYAAVYPRIVKAMAKARSFDWLDLRGALPQEGQFYIDFSHLTANGNSIIAERIVRGFK